MELPVHPGEPVAVSAAGVEFAGISTKGKPTPGGGALAGFLDLRVLDAKGACLFALAEHLDEILEQGAAFSLAGADRIRFTRRQVAYTDMVKGELAKPLDSMKDFVIVRSDGSPVFHLANVCDDITQGITHIIRGDDHVENTYRHIFLFAALGAQPPRYGHLPMIVNAQGKPYSKRDGDAFVGDFRDKGFLPEALFNYLTLLGWSPGDDREKMGRDELVAAFRLDRVQQSSAQVDLRKLQNLNGQYIAEMPFAEFVANCRAAATGRPWFAAADAGLFEQVAALLQSRTKLFADVAGWDYFFVDVPEYDAKALAKFVAKDGTPRRPGAPAREPGGHRLRGSRRPRGRRPCRRGRIRDSRGQAQPARPRGRDRLRRRRGRVRNPVHPWSRPLPAASRSRAGALPPGERLGDASWRTNPVCPSWPSSAAPMSASPRSSTRSWDEGCPSSTSRAE